MITGDNRPLSTEGELTVPFTQFPTEVLEKMIAMGGQMPLLNITLHRVVLTNGLQMGDLEGPLQIKFDFEAGDIEVTES